MNKSLVLVASVLLLTSCVTKVRGKFDVMENITLKTKKKMVTIKEGTYRGTLGFKTKKKLTLKLDLDGEAGKKITFTLPKGIRISDYSGDFEIPASTTGQKYGIKGHVDTKTETSRLFEGVETCYNREIITRCRRVPNNNNGYTRVCTDTSISFEGRRYYTYFHETDDRIFELDLLSNLGTRMASFDGNRRDSRTIRLHSTPCITKYNSYRYGYRHSGRYGRFGRHRH
ncbi:MAG: hypothetical protein HN576_08015 [Bacteriovoracaceae bacterium]|jgi:hypothetical protein|nr:hypothetical protein [Bacteriovoracaceae bacterium]